MGDREESLCLSLPFFLPFLLFIYCISLRFLSPPCSSQSSPSFLGLLLNMLQALQCRYGLLKAILHACSVTSVMSNSLRPHGLQPARLLCPWGFSRQEYWSGLPCPPPGDLPNPGIEPRFPALQADCLPSERPGKPNKDLLYNKGTTALYSTIT